MRHRGQACSCGRMGTGGTCAVQSGVKKKVLMVASVASMIDQFNMPNIRLLLKMGYEVHVMCNLKNGNTCDIHRLCRFQKTLRSMHVVLHQWDCPRCIRSLRKCMTAYRQLLELVGKYRYEWIHCHSPIGGVLARLVARQRGIRIIYTAHGFHFYKGAPLRCWLLYYPVEKLLARWTDVLVTVNREDYLFAKRKLRAGRIYRIPGVGIDTGRFRNAQPERKKFCRQFRLPEDAWVLLSVGELNKGKNHQVVLKALARLARTDVYYMVCGQGPMQKNLQRLAEKLGIAGQVRMPGYQEDMPWIYRNADIFVFPSRREGMPAALMEAMAAGLPCLASNIRGNRELICGQDRAGGRLFSWKQPKELTAALDGMLADSRERQECGKYNQLKAKAYDWMIVEKQMYRIYTSISALEYLAGR